MRATNERRRVTAPAGASVMPASANDDLLAPDENRVGKQNRAALRWMRSSALRWCATGLAVALAAVAIGMLWRGLKSMSFNQTLPEPDGDVVKAGLQGWPAALEALRRSSRKHVIVDTQYGLGNRLRTLASAMAVAAAEKRPLVVVWTPDLHCNCSIRTLFAAPLPFVVIEEPTPPDLLRQAELMRWSVRTESENLTTFSPVVDVADSKHSWMQVYDYMTGRQGRSAEEIKRDQWIDVDVTKHFFVRSAFMLHHARGEWLYAKWQLGTLRPAPAIARHLIADTSFVGIHVRSVFDAPRSESTAKDAKGSDAMSAAGAEYGHNQSLTLRAWRDKGRWPQFVERIAQEPESTRFYLAADSQDAYDGLMSQFPGRITRTERRCSSTERCDFRDCESVHMALADMLNLARTSRILGSYYSSFSEVAAIGFGTRWPFGKAVPREYAGVNFGAGAAVPMQPELSLEEAQEASRKQWRRAHRHLGPDRS